MDKDRHWILTDDDSSQLCCRMDEGNVFELYQVTKLPESYGISHGVIDMDHFFQNDFESVLQALNSFGYKSLDEFVEEISPDNDFIVREDGTIDPESPSYIIDYQLIAEMLFEMGAMDEYLLDEFFPTFELASSRISELTGYTLS